MLTEGRRGRAEARGSEDSGPVGLKSLVLPVQRACSLAGTLLLTSEWGAWGQDGSRRAEILSVICLCVCSRVLCLFYFLLPEFYFH